MNDFQMNRRQSLIASGLGTMSLGMPGTVLGSDKVDASGKAVRSDKCCIFVLLCGGPSHVGYVGHEAGGTAGVSRAVRTDFHQSSGHALK